MLRRIRNALTGQWAAAGSEARDPAGHVTERYQPQTASDAPVRAVRRVLHARGYDLPYADAALVAEAALQATGHKPRTVERLIPDEDWTAREAQRLVDDLTRWLDERLQEEFPKLSNSRRVDAVFGMRSYLLVRLGIVSENGDHDAT